MLLYNEYFLVLGRICLELINKFPFLDVERKLDEVLREGEFDLIEEKVTVKTLTSCKTNALLKAFEVSYLLLLGYLLALHIATCTARTLHYAIPHSTHSAHSANSSHSTQLQDPALIYVCALGSTWGGLLGVGVGN